MNRLSVGAIAPHFLLILLPVLLFVLLTMSGCAQRNHLQYDFGRAYTVSMQVQADLERPGIPEPYPLTGAEAVLLRANVVKQDSSEKTGKVEAIGD